MSDAPLTSGGPGDRGLQQQEHEAGPGVVMGASSPEHEEKQEVIDRLESGDVVEVGQGPRLHAARAHAQWAGGPCMRVTCQPWAPVLRLPSSPTNALNKGFRTLMQLVEEDIEETEGYEGFGGELVQLHRLKGGLAMRIWGPACGLKTMEQHTCNSHDASGLHHHAWHQSRACPSGPVHDALQVQ